MISTVTTSTVTTVTTMVAGLGIAMGIVAGLALVAFMCFKELTGVGGNGSQGNITKSLNIAIIPLTIVFGVIVITEVVRILA